jgi:hypothetical protein
MAYEAFTVSGLINLPEKAEGLLVHVSGIPRGTLLSVLQASMYPLGVFGMLKDEKSERVVAFVGYEAQFHQAALASVMLRAGSELNSSVTIEGKLTLEPIISGWSIRMDALYAFGYRIIGESHESD